MVRPLLRLLAATVVLAHVVIACDGSDLNPQPLPPGKGASTGGGESSSGGTDSSGDTPSATPGGTDGGTAGPDLDAGDGGDGGDGGK